MTALERWVKGISGGFGTVLGAVLLVLFWSKLQSQPPSFSFFFQPLSFFFYFMIGGSYLLGWLGGSKEERKVRKPLIAE